MWLAEQVDPPVDRFAIGELIEIDAPLDPAVFEAALGGSCGSPRSALVRRRARTAASLQELDLDMAWELPVVDLAAHEPTPGRPWTPRWPTVMRRGFAARRPRAAVRPPAVPGRRPHLVVLGRPPHRGRRLHRPAGPAGGWPSCTTAWRPAGRRGAAAPGTLARLVEGDGAYAASPAAERDGDWWRARLAGAPSPVRLAADRRAARAARTLRRAVTRSPEPRRPAAGRGLDRRPPTLGPRHRRGRRLPPPAHRRAGPGPRACRSPPARARHARRRPGCWPTSCRCGCG